MHHYILFSDKIKNIKLVKKIFETLFILGYSYFIYNNRLKLKMYYKLMQHKKYTKFLEITPIETPVYFIFHHTKTSYNATVNKLWVFKNTRKSTLL